MKGEKTKMYKKINLLKNFIYFLICMGFFLNIAFAKDKQKIAIFDMQKIVSESIKGKEAAINMRKLSEDLKNEVIDLKEKIQKFDKEIRNQASILSIEKQKEKIRNLRIMTNDFKYLQEKYPMELKKYENKMSAEINYKVIEIVKEFGEKNNYTLILEKREAGVVYAPESIDITNELIKKYDENFKK